MTHGSRSPRWTALAAAVLLLVVSTASVVSTALAAGSGGITERYSVTSGSPGAQQSAPGVVSGLGPALSPDGRFIVFSSDSTNLVAGDTNGATDVFLRDRQNNTTERVSITSTGTQAPDSAVSGTDKSSVSADGRYVAFSSYGRMTATPTNGYRQVYVRDRQAGTTVLVSVSLTAGAGDQDSYQPSISADGRYVAFASSSDNLVSGDSNTTADIFVRDLQGNTTTRVSLATGGGQLTEECFSPSISGTGRYIAFRRSVYVPQYFTHFYEIWVRDTVGATLTRLSVPVTGLLNGDCLDPVISQDGNYVAFEASATNIYGAPANGKISVIRMPVTGATAGAVLVSKTTAGAEANDNSDSPAISSDGRYVAFRSDATNLATDANGHGDVFVRDCTGNTTVLDSQSTAAVQGDNDSYAPAISADGGFVAFASSATNLVAGDTNGADDIFGRLNDATAPVTSAQMSPSANGMGWWKSDVQVSLSATDNGGSGVAGVSYAINGGGTSAYSTPFAVSTAGTTTLGYRATDNAGNGEATKTVTIKIDKTLPTLTLDAAPGSVHVAPFSVHASPSDAISGIDTTQDVEMNLDGGGWFKERNISVNAGTHTVNARVSDNAGNQQTASVQVTVNLAAPDTNAPNTTASPLVAQGTWVNATTAPSSLIATDDASGVSQTVWWLNAGAHNTLPTSPAASSAQLTPLIPWVQGVNTLYFYSIDASGNTETTRNVTLSYDSVAPAIGFDVEATTYNSGTRVVHATPSDGGSGVNAATAQICVDGGSWQAGTSITVPLGTHSVTARVTDNAGNTTQTTSATFTVAAAPVAVSLSTPRTSGTLKSTKVVTYSGSVTPGHAVQVTLTFQRLTSHKYRTYKTIRVNANAAGGWSYKLKLKKGSYKLYATTPASAAWLAGKSGTKSFKIK